MYWNIFSASPYPVASSFEDAYPTILRMLCIYSTKDIFDCALPAECTIQPYLSRECLQIKYEIRAKEKDYDDVSSRIFLFFRLKSTFPRIFVRGKTNSFPEYY